MLNNITLEKNKQYIKDFDERSIFLGWLKFCKIQFNGYLPVTPNYIILPSNQDIKNELFLFLNNNTQCDLYIELIHIYSQIHLIKENELKIINQKDIRLIYQLYYLLMTRKQQTATTTFKSMFYTISNEFPYTAIKDVMESQNFCIPISKHYLIKKIAPSSFSLNWRTNNPDFQINKLDYDTLIREYDIWEIHAKDKLIFIKESINQFIHNKTQDDKIAWLNANDPTQLEWAINYLKKSNFYNTIPYFHSVTSQYDLILIILDSLEYHYRSIFIEKMKKSWTQQKYRNSGKVKSQYHLPLTKDCKTKLNKLSLIMNMSENKLLEVLINEKYKSEAIDEKGNFKY